MPNDSKLAIEHPEKFFEIAKTFLILYETYTGEESDLIAFNDETRDIFANNKFLFGKVVLEMHALFDVPLKHLPLDEFATFPKVSDLLLYIYNNRESIE